MAQEGKPFAQRWKGQRQARERHAIREQYERLRRELGSRRLITYEEVEALLPGFNRRRIRRYVERGILVRATINHNHSRFTIESVQALANAQTAATTTPERPPSPG